MLNWSRAQGAKLKVRPHELQKCIIIYVLVHVYVPESLNLNKKKTILHQPNAPPFIYIQLSKKRDFISKKSIKIRHTFAPSSYFAHRNCTTFHIKERSHRTSPFAEIEAQWQNDSKGAPFSFFSNVIVFFPYRRHSCRSAPAIF